MFRQQMKTAVFIAWIVFYVSALLVLRRMWTGKYLRSPLARALFVGMVSEGEATGQESQEVRENDYSNRWPSLYFPLALSDLMSEIVFHQFCCPTYMSDCVTSNFCLFIYTNFHTKKWAICLKRVPVNKPTTFKITSQ